MKPRFIDHSVAMLTGVTQVNSVEQVLLTVTVADEPVPVTGLKRKMERQNKNQFYLITKGVDLI